MLLFSVLAMSKVIHKKILICRFIYLLTLTKEPYTKATNIRNRHKVKAIYVTGYSINNFNQVHFSPSLWHSGEQHFPWINVIEKLPKTPPP